MIRAIVGAGGKTTYIRKKAKDFLAEGKKVFVTTSTHMYTDKYTLLTDDAEQIIEELEKKGYAMAGNSAGGKLGTLSYDTYVQVCAHADEVLIEADGSKHFPLKFPNDREPVIYENVEEIVVISGTHGIWRSAVEAVHRMELSHMYGVSLEKDTIITPQLYQRILEAAYLRHLKGKYPDKAIVHAPNKSLGVQIGCILMASGESKRFGSNKLLAEINGKTLMEHILDTTKGLFDRIVVLTRSEEIKGISEKYEVEVILHDKFYRNESIALGMQRMEGMDACMFCVCDQPFLRRESIIQMNHEFAMSREGIYRLGYRSEMGAPVLFSRDYFEELKHLPEKRGGSYVAEQFSDSVRKVEALDKRELLDIDTVEMYERLCKEAEDMKEEPRN